MNIENKYKYLKYKLKYLELKRDILLGGKPKMPGIGNVSNLVKQFSEKAKSADIGKFANKAKKAAADINKIKTIKSPKEFKKIQNKIDGIHDDENTSNDTSNDSACSKNLGVISNMIKSLDKKITSIQTQLNQFMKKDVVQKQRKEKKQKKTSDEDIDLSGTNLAE
jgi:hypothetical protein